MGHLFYTELGGGAGESLSNTDAFQNLGPRTFWSGTLTQSPVGAARYFSMGSGEQHFANQGTSYYAMVVRTGDVAGMVPEPHTYALI